MAKSHRALFVTLSLLLLAVCPADEARAEQVVTKAARFVQRAQRIDLTVGFREMFDAKLRRRLRSGFATTVVMRLYLYEVGRSKPLAVSVRTLRALYDLWEERFILQLKEPGRTRTAYFEQRKDVVDRLTSVWRFPLVTLDRVQSGREYFVAGLVEVNPMSQDVLKEVRRWLRKPQRRQRSGTGENFFGSFVSIFVNDKVRRAEKIFKFRTQPFVRAKP